MSGSMSPLLMQALMSGGGGVPQDPSVMAAMPRVQLAQAMMQEGMSGTPTSKWGAFGRVGQALAGNYMFGEANQGLQNIIQQRQANSSDALKSFFATAGAGAPGTPGGNAPAGSPTSGGAATPSAGTPFTTQLGAAEAPNPQAVNAQGFSGQDQFGTARLASTGLYNPAQGEDLKANQWKGTFNVPGFPNVKTQSDFLANPPAQHAALMVDIANTDHAIANTPGARGLDQNGLRAVAHLGGVEGMQKFVATGGKYNPADANGTHLSDYYQRFAGAPPPSAGQSGPAGQPPPTGQQAPQTAQSLDLMRKAMLYGASSPYDPIAQKNAGMMMDYAKTLGTLDTFRTGAGGVQTNLRTGQQSNAATPLANYQLSPTGNTDITHTHPDVFARPEVANQLTMSQLGGKLARGEPLTSEETIQLNTALGSYQKPQLVTTSPSQTVTAAPTRASPLAGVVPPAAPGGAPAAPPLAGPRAAPPPGVGMSPAITPAMPSPAATGAPGVVVAPNPDAIAEQAQKAAQGTASGTQAALTPSRMVKMGQEASMNLGTIASTIGQLNAAQQKGLPTGYFGPEWASGLAAMKNLGVNTASFGVDPSAISDIQAGNKSLALVAGGIVRNILGPDSQITEGKLQTFIHATPGLETDPGALQKILSWAQSQAQYNKDMALDAMHHVDPGTGMIHPAWEPQYYAKQGSFGPIYNPLHGEMEQPKGAPPTATPAQTPAAPARADVETEMRRRGLIK